MSVLHDVPYYGKNRFRSSRKIGKDTKTGPFDLVHKLGRQALLDVCDRLFFIGYLFRDFLPGTETLASGEEVELWRSYIAGAILLGIAPCTAMILMWGYLAKGNDGLTLVMVAINSLVMLVLYGPLGGLLLDMNAMPVPWRTMLLSVSIYVTLPLIAGYLSRKWVIRYKGIAWFNEAFLHWLTPISITALLLTLVLLFSFKGEVVISNPLTILWIAVPLFIQTVVIFTIGYFVLARRLKLSYHDAATMMPRRRR